MSYPHATNTDLLDRLVDVPPTRNECAQILAFFLPRVADSSPAIEDTEYGQAHRELSAAVQHGLKESEFVEAVILGHEITVRASGFKGAGPYSHFPDDHIARAFSFIVDCLVEDVNR